MDSPVPKASERRALLPEAVDDVIARAMAKAPDDRYASAGEAVAALRGALGL
jgi:serine/threonine-protein kinase